ncbi:MAG: efflux RND transporter periplasmic adaptor subunit [Pseudomonadota bacterium]
MGTAARTVTAFGWMVLALNIAGCGGSSDHAARVAAAAPLESRVVQMVRAPVERQLDGAIEAVNQGTVAAQTAGRVAEIFFDVNDFVPAGAVIVRLRATEQRAGLLQAEAALREAQARAAEAQTQYQRFADMFERKLVARAAFDEGKANRDAAVARLAAAQAALGSAREGVSYTEIRAPYAGIVTRRHVQPGETVGPGTPLVSGLSLQYLRVAVDIPQSLVEQVRRIRKAAVYVNGRRIEAKKLTIFPEAAATSNTFRARLELPENAADLYPGMFVKVGFVIGEADRLLVPARSIVERSEVTAVYVIDAESRVALRQVRCGHRFADDVEILAGLAAGERLALDPLAAMQRLDPAAGAD